MLTILFMGGYLYVETNMELPAFCGGGRKEEQMKKNVWAAAVLLSAAVMLAGGTFAYAAEPVYTEEELEADGDKTESFTMPVIVNATDHTKGGNDGGDDGGQDDGGGGDTGGNGDTGSGGGGDNPSPGAAEAGQTFVVTVTDRFVNRAGEELFISVCSIGKYKKGTYLLFSATKTKGYTITGQKLQSVTVERDTEIVFTYVESDTDTGANAGRTKAEGAEESKPVAETEESTVSGDEAEEAQAESEETEEELTKRTPVIRREQETKAEETETPQEPSEQEETEEKKPFHIPWWVWLIGILLVIGAAVTALAFTGKLSFLWLLFLSRFFRSRWKPWHGILTKQENRFIDTVSTEEGGGELLQSVIDREGTSEAVLLTAEESGDMTYLPPNTRIAVSWQDGGEYPAVENLKADEKPFYELLQGLSGKGEVIATFFNDPAQIEFALTFRL